MGQGRGWKAYADAEGAEIPGEVLEAEAKLKRRKKADHRGKKVTPKPQETWSQNQLDEQENTRGEDGKTSVQGTLQGRCLGTSPHPGRRRSDQPPRFQKHGGAATSTPPGRQPGHSSPQLPQGEALCPREYPRPCRQGPPPSTVLSEAWGQQTSAMLDQTACSPGHNQRLGESTLSKHTSRILATRSLSQEQKEMLSAKVHSCYFLKG